MGATFTKIWQWLFVFKVEGRVLMLGLDGSGKTTILYKLKLGEVISTIPTIGFNVETMQLAKVNLTVWDVGGQEKIRVLWKHYFNGTHGIIYVVDSVDRERIQEASSELNRILSDSELDDVPLLVLANKQDVDGAMSVAEICNSLNLHSFRNRSWYMQACSATRGEGLEEGFTWFCETHKKRRTTSRR